MPIAGLAVIPVLLNYPVILLPAHIAFLHLMIEPACSVPFEAEPEAPGAMRRPPRSRGEHLYGRGILLPTLIQGGSVLAILIAVFLTA